VGAQADSGHEYLLKHYLLTAQTDKPSLELCEFSDSVSSYSSDLSSLQTSVPRLTF
jgi:hypothetical protein